MPETETWTIKKLLEWTSEYFSRNNSDSPRLEAEILLAKALECERIELYTRFNDIPPESNLGHFREWVKRRAAGEPVAYLVGHREFYSLQFKVNSDVLIPRPETEHVVVQAIECGKEFAGSNLAIADVGTGSGCIAIAVAKHIPQSKLVAVDVSPAALAVARANAQTHQVDSRIEFVESDLFESVSPGEFQMILSNPPYIGECELDTVDESVRSYEPAIALFSGSDGTSLIQRLLDQAASRLVEGGYLIFESSPIIMDRCLKMVDSQDRLSHVKTVKDLAGHRRVVVARKL